MSSVAGDATGFKERVRSFWNGSPCGTRSNPHPRGSAPYFDWIEEERDRREPFIAKYAAWQERTDQRVLEMGVGAGTDFIRFLRAGAHAIGVDLSDESIRLVRRRLELENLHAPILVTDIEALPFRSDSFDAVYSWGVIHHTEDPPRAAAELLRVLRPGGRFTVMVYHRYSLVALQAYLLYGVLRGQPRLSLDSIARDHLESYGTKLYSRAAAKALFEGQRTRVDHVVTPYDLRYSRFRYMPAFIGKLIPQFFGYFMILEGVKE